MNSHVLERFLVRLPSLPECPSDTFFPFKGSARSETFFLFILMKNKYRC